MNKKFDLLIGNKKLSFLLPEKNLIKVLEPKELSSLDGKKAIKQALEKPIGTARLSKIVNRGEKVAIVVSDITRLWVRSNVFLPFILKELNKGGIPDKDMFIVLGNGVHRDQTPEEIKLIVGKEVYSRIRVYNHHCKNKNEFTYLGKTTYGTPVWLNRLVVEADRIVLTGGIVYHFLSGWSGGKKAVLPGIASFDCIMANHRLGLYPEEGKGLNPDVCAGKMKSNPVSVDAIQAANFLKPDFILNVVLNTEQRFGKIVAGDMIKAHETGCRIVEEYFGVEIKEKADLVIISCGGYPRDINFYQSYKTLYNADGAVRKGGVVILVAECREGIGDDNFYRIFTDFEDNVEREKFLRENYEIGRHMGFHTALMAADHSIIVISELPEEIIKNMNMIPAENMDKALNIAYHKLGNNPQACIMPHGSITFPNL